MIKLIGIYFGRDLNDSDTRPLHGSNIWLNDTLGEEMKIVVGDYMRHVETLADRIFRYILKSLNLTENQFKTDFMDPTILFRIFNYPPHNTTSSIYSNSYAVGEHSDYGYITVLYQDDSGGLQVKLADGNWVDANPVHTFFINYIILYYIILYTII